MSKTEFMTLIQILKSYYLDWSFELSNRMVVETWYQYLQDLGFERLKKVVNFYISTHDAGPNSPRDLMRSHFELELKDMIHKGEPTNE